MSLNSGWYSETDRRNAAHLYVHNSEELAANKSYNPELIRKAARREGSFDEMISKFEDSNKGVSELRMSDFYTYFWYHDFKEKFPSANISNLIYNVLSILRLADKDNICFHLSKDKRFTPERLYKRSVVKMIFSAHQMHNKFHILDEFELYYKDKDNLIMQDFYDFCEYSFPYRRLIWRDIQIVLSDIDSRVKEIQKNASVVKLSEMNPKYFLSYIFAISIGLYCPFSNKSPDITTPENHQNKLKDYLSFINNIADTWESAVDIDFLTSLDSDNIGWFYRDSMMLIDDLQSIDLESQNFVSAWEQANAILKKYTDISQQDKILWFIEKHGKDNPRLESFREAILNLHTLLIETNIKNSKEDNPPRETLVFWREEQEMETNIEPETSEPHTLKQPDRKLEHNWYISQTIEIILDADNRLIKILK